MTLNLKPMGTLKKCTCFENIADIRFICYACVTIPLHISICHYAFLDLSHCFMIGSSKFM